MPCGHRPSCSALDADRATSTRPALRWFGAVETRRENDHAPSFLDVGASEQKPRDMKRLVIAVLLAVTAPAMTGCMGSQHSGRAARGYRGDPRDSAGNLPPEESTLRPCDVHEPLAVVPHASIATPSR